MTVSQTATAALVKKWQHNVAAARRRNEMGNLDTVSRDASSSDVIVDPNASPPYPIDGGSITDDEKRRSNKELTTPTKTLAKKKVGGGEEHARFNK